MHYFIPSVTQLIDKTFDSRGFICSFKKIESIQLKMFGGYKQYERTRI